MTSWPQIDNLSIGINTVTNLYFILSKVYLKIHFMLEPLFGTPFSTDQAKEFNWSFCSMKIKQTTPIYEKELYLSLAIYYEWSFISLKCFQPTARATTRRVWRLVFESDGFFGLNCIGKQEQSSNNDCQKHSCRK